MHGWLLVLWLGMSPLGGSIPPGMEHIAVETYSNKNACEQDRLYFIKDVGSRITALSDCTPALLDSTGTISAIKTWSRACSVCPQPPRK